MNLSTYFAALAFLIPFAILFINWFVEYSGIKSRKKKREEYYEQFEKIVKNLSSENPSSQLSAAVLLRRFFNIKIGGKYFLYDETINVISSILRTLPTNVYQKTLADNLAYASDLSNADLQRTNLQNIYLGSKHNIIKLYNTDLFMANLTFGLIDNVDAKGIILYNALLFGTIIKNSDLSNANFVGADLTNVRFKNVILLNANFNKATNIPKEISEKLVDGIYQSGSPVSTQTKQNEKIIFFSMPGSMSKTDELNILAYRQYLNKLGFEVIYYKKDTYPRFGQLSQIKAAISRCSAMIAFGVKQTLIKEGIYRPGMTDQHNLNECWISTPWNEVEVGMATMIGMPILLVKDDEIENGIFDNILSETFISTLSSKTDVSELEKNQTFTAWLSQIA